MVRHSKTVFALGLAAAVSACGLPGPLRDSAERLATEIRSARAAVQQRVQAYETFSASSDFEFFAPYAERGRWADALDEARQLVDAADSVYRDSIALLLEEDRSGDAAALETALLAVQEQLAEAKRRAARPAERRRFIETARDSASTWVQEADERFAAAGALLDSVRPAVVRAREEFPSKDEDLEARWATLIQARDSAATRLGTARREAAASAAGRAADYAALAAAIAYIREADGQLAAAARDVGARTDQLSRSYSRVLTDMRQDYFVQVGRTSWDNSSDARTDVNHLYPARQVSRQAYETLLTRPPDDALASYKDDLFGDDRSVRIDEAIWQALRVDWIASWPGSAHDAAEYWLNNAYTQDYHRYLVLEDGDTSVTDWVGVDEETFAEHIDHLGMAIVAKPYGFYEDEAIQAASPPGLAYVGNPRYGEWRTEADGRSSWQWAGQYLFLAALFGGSPFRYGRADWDCWQGYRSRGQAYYGCNSRNPVYGTWGSMTRGSPRYRRTTFGSRGGFRTPDPSVRGAGPIARGRGPGGIGK